MKRLILFFVFIWLFLPSSVFAGNNLTITCNNGSGCTKSSNLPLFAETNIYPGFTHFQTFSVDNNRNGACHLKLKATSTNQLPNILSDKIFIDILGTNSGNDYSLVNYSLKDLLDPTKPFVSLGHVNKNIKNNYLWSVMFSSDAGNDYQNLTNNFNLNFNFECDQDSTDNPSNTSSNNPPSNQGTSPCSNSIPSAPTQLSATRLSTGNISLQWTKTTNNTGYLIAYGTSPGNYQYGADNVGNVSSYTVQGLTYGAQYCFYVRSLNGCMPGGRTPEYCVNPGSVVVPANIVPTGFEPNVLGAVTDTTQTGQVQGENAAGCVRSWPYLLALALILGLIHFKIQIKLSKTNFIFKYLSPLFITILALIADYFLNRQCYTFPFILAPIALVLPYIYYLLLRRRTAGN